MKKKPDLVVWDENKGWYAKSLPYASNVGAPPIKPENINLWKISNVDKANKYFSTKFNELVEELNKLKEEYEWTELIYRAKYNFEPVIGNSYFLYKDNEVYFLSLISAKEWNSKYEYIGEFKFDSKNTWIKI